MANSNTPFGFRPMSHRSGGTPARTAEYTIASAYGTAIYTGDLVFGAGANSDRVIQTANLAATTGVLGPFRGVQYVDAAGNVVFSPYWPASTALLSGSVAVAHVIDDPMVEFIAQMSTYAVADAGGAFEVTLGTGSAVTGQSGSSINQGATTNVKVRVTGLAQFNGAMSETGAYAKVRCILTPHERASGALPAAY